MARPDCDSLYVLADGTFARLQFWAGETFRKVDAAGAVEIIPMGAVQTAALGIGRAAHSRKSNEGKISAWQGRGSGGFDLPRL